MSEFLEKSKCWNYRHPKRFTIRSCVHGFSMIEVVVAMSIMVVGILAVAQMKIISQRNVTSGNVVTIALLIAHAEIEKIRISEDIAGLQQSFSSDPDSHDPFKVSYTFSDLMAEAMDQPFQANCETGRYDGSGSCIAAVTVSWNRGTGGRGGAGSLQLKTMVKEGRI